jgi:predicted nucleic acid-binding protein
VDAFDADVLIYAASADHPLGRRVRRLFEIADDSDMLAGVGSLLLVPEVLRNPLRDAAAEDLDTLGMLLARLDLRPVDAAIAHAAAALGATYRLRAADAVHLATAVLAGADRFVTNNAADIPKAIAEIDVTYPDDLDP